MTRKGKSAFFYFATVVIATCCLAKTIDCLRFKKTERREARKQLDATKPTAFQEGTILFGRTFESQGLDGTKKSNDSSEDDSAYQADYAGWSMVPVQDSSSKEALWRRMTPSLQCGGDQLKFRAVGPGVTHFKIDQGNAPPTPLSQVPPSCGYTMQRNPFGLALQVPYDGCNMVQEGGNYMLPMRWQGVPVLLSCPKPQMPGYPPQMPVQQHYGKTPDMSQPQYLYFPYQQYPAHPQQHQQYPAYPQQHQQYPAYPQQHQQYPSSQQHQQYPSSQQHQQYPSSQQHQQYPSFPAPSNWPASHSEPAQQAYPYPFYPFQLPQQSPHQKGSQTTTPTTTLPTTTTVKTTTTTTPTTTTTTTPTTTTQTTTKSTLPPVPPFIPFPQPIFPFAGPSFPRIPNYPLPPYFQPPIYRV